MPVARVVVMDDSKLMRRVLTAFLEHAGHTVEEWEPMSAMEVPDRAAATEMDLLVCDFQMPGCNGATVARMARRAKPDLPILIVTALRDAETLDLLKKAHVAGILHKPIEEESFLRQVNEALGVKV